MDLALSASANAEKCRSGVRAINTQFAFCSEHDKDAASNQCATTMPETVAPPRTFMLPAWRAAALAYRAARRDGNSHHHAPLAAQMAIQVHHPTLTEEEASAESVNAIAYASSYRTAWFWHGVATGA
jgi:hypothetical protein